MENNLSLQVATGTVILRERRKRHLTQQILADQAGLQRVYLVGIEGGRRSVSLAVIFALAQAMGMPAAELVRKIQAELGSG
ncbi:MAG TPA: helix-turn-helix transcriptional regulator [Candidatus Avidesulfovibrio excrementigallinarum]|nr:helix-turn-helix transcriptional regulator [Candidatus Avidesulfovibrio excrementigallinarum]